MLQILVPAFVLLAIAGGVYATIYFDHLFPFDLNRAPNAFTRFHLSVLKREPDRCRAALERAGVRFQPALPLAHAKGCGYEDAVRLQGSGVAYGNGVLLQCPATLALLLWERHVLMPAAREHLQREVRSVRHLGTYSCRPIMGRADRSLSQHAFANAIDVAAVTLEGGETVSVLRDWSDAGDKGRFLRALRDGACRIFGATLSPEFNAAHANHFHFDMGRWRVCR